MGDPQTGPSAGSGDDRAGGEAQSTHDALIQYRQAGSPDIFTDYEPSKSVSYQRRILCLFSARCIGGGVRDSSHGHDYY
ncbi:MAG TPA: hypothetical protein P5307_18990, partial [Pirellulaceae bacterium]|nr:hypothetical protein [Pirellulaceae bacterium]